MRIATWLALAVLVPTLTVTAFGSARAAGLFVSTNGDDGDSGSIGQPWRTVQYALDQLDPGDTLYVRGGIYFESVEATRSGTPFEPIVVRSYPGERGVIDSGTPLFRTVANNDWELVNASIGEYRSVQSVSGEAIDAYIDGIPGYENERVALVPYDSLSHFRATTDQFGATFYVGPGVIFVGDRVHIRLAKTDDLRAAEARYGTVFATENADPRQYSIILSTSPTTLEVSGAYWEFHSLDFNQGKETIRVTAGAHHITFDGITAWLGDSTIEIEGAYEIEIVRSRIYGDYPYWIFWSDMKDAPAPADRLRSTSVDLNSGAHDIEISYSHIRGGGQDLIGTRDNEYNVFIHHNRIENGGDDAIELEGTIGVGWVSIHDNYFLNSLTTIAPAQSTPNFTGPLLVYRNVMALLRDHPVNRQEGINTWNGGFRFGYNYMFKHSDNPADVSRNAHYYHNTMVLLNNSGRGLNIVPSDPTDCRIANNVEILVNGNVNRDFRSGPGVVIDGNLYWKVNIVDNDDLLSDHRTVPEFHAETGFEANGLGDVPLRGTDPDFPSFALDVVDPSQVRWAIAPSSERPPLSAFIPSSSSPVMGAGITIPAVAGIGSLPDTRSSFDIGALPLGTLPSELAIFPFDPDALPGTPGLLGPQSGSFSGSLPTFDWSDVVDASGVSYTLQVSGTPSFAAPLIDATGLTTSSYTVATPITTGAYFWRVRAVDGLGQESAWSEVRTLIVDALAPPAAGLIEPADGALSGPAPLFDWTDVNDLSGVSYSIQIDDDNDFSSPEVEFSGLGASRVTPVGLSTGVFVWRVRVVDGVGLESPWSEVRDLTIDATAPDVPQLLSPPDGAFNDPTPGFDWSTVNDISGVHYRLQVDDDSSFATPIADTSGIVPSAAILTPLPSGAFKWRVRAVDGVGLAGGWTAPRDLFIDAEPPGVASLVVPADGAAMTTTPVFDWNDVTDPSGVTYRFQVDNDPDFSSPTLSLTGFVQSVITSASFGEGTYAWRVGATDGVGHEGPWSESRTFTIDATAPAAAQLITPSDGGFAGSVPFFDWSDVSDPSGVAYQLQIDDLDSFDSPLVDLSGLPASNHTGTAVAVGTYFWRVRPRDGVGLFGPWSTVRSFSIDATAPGAAVLIVPEDGDTLTGAPVFDWADVSDPSGVSYRFQRDDDPAFGSPETDVAGLSSSVYAPGSVTSGTHYWRVKTLDGVGLTSDWSEVRSFTVEDGPETGIGGLLVTRETDWLYHDQGQDLGTAWRELVYDETGWASGPGVFGYGESYITTTVSFGPDGGNKHMTTYFRRTFNVLGAAAVTGADLHVRFDDGIVVYLNGTEVARASMPSGPITYDTDASSHEGDQFETIDLTPHIGLFQEGTNVLAVELHQSSPSSSDLVFDAELESFGSGLPGNDTSPPPIPDLVAPADLVTVPRAPTLDWSDVHDPSGVLYAVQIDDDPAFSSPVLDTNGVAPSSLVLAGLADGAYAWRVQAVDGVGFSSGWSPHRSFTLSTPPPGPGVGGLLVARNAMWAYDDQGMDLGSAWRDTTFEDSAWPQGVGVLGYGESYIATTVSYGPDPDNRHVTTYFRKRFDVIGAAGVTGLTLRLMYDDGVAAYLNGVEVTRLSLPAGPLTFDTEASGHEADELYEEFDLFAHIGLLVEGENVLAIEVHQTNTTSSDMVFDAELESEGSGVHPNVSVGPGHPEASETLRAWPVPYRRGMLTVAFSAPPAATVDVAVFDLAGRRVKSLAHGRFSGGLQRLTWDGRSDRGAALATGVYILRAQRGATQQTRKLIVVR